MIHYCVMTYEGDDRLVHRQLKSFPWVISRYMKASNERYGRGPVLYALPDIKTLNKVVELTLKMPAYLSAVCSRRWMMAS